MQPSLAHLAPSSQAPLLPYMLYRTITASFAVIPSVAGLVQFFCVVVYLAGCVPPVCVLGVFVVGLLAVGMRVVQLVAAVQQLQQVSAWVDVYSVLQVDVGLVSKRLLRLAVFSCRLALCSSSFVAVAHSGLFVDFVLGCAVAMAFGCLASISKTKWVEKLVLPLFWCCCCFAVVPLAWCCSRCGDQVFVFGVSRKCISGVVLVFGFWVLGCKA
ncbi:hypothetical protein U1Q18_007737 [Sarracenia purpurea var. burkii]